MVAMTRRQHSGNFLTLVTLGVSELIASSMTEPDLPEDRLPPVAEALARAYCDPSPEVSGTAERELGDMRAAAAGPALARAARSCDGRRAVAAVALIEDRTVKYLKLKREVGGGHDPKWADLPGWAAALEEVAASDRPEVRTRGVVAKAKVGAALDVMAMDLVHETHYTTLSDAIERHAMPLYGAAIERAAPAFRARLADPDARVRLAAARVVWRLEGSTPASLDRLAKDPRADGPAEAGAAPDGANLAALVRNHDNGQFLINEELTRLAHQGRRAARAANAIRACLTLKDLPFDGTPDLAAAALAFVTEDRALLPDLQRRHEQLLATKALTPGGSEELLPQAILLLSPDDPKARAALGLEQNGPLYTAVLRKAIQDEHAHWLWWLALLQQQAASGPPRAP
jgi:hypothetical protein